MLRRRVLRDEYMKNEELKKKDKLRTKNITEEEEFLVSIPISDLRKILQAKEYTHKATMREWLWVKLTISCGKFKNL